MDVWIIINECSGVSSGANKPQQGASDKVKQLSKSSGYLRI
jgi:hypothetical protein